MKVLVVLKSGIIVTGNTTEVGSNHKAPHLPNATFHISQAQIISPSIDEAKAKIHEMYMIQSSEVAALGTSED